eukprot:Anaeramoba_ignava/a1208_25.p1 GENE.a1208_25~~a1208_25.p1  ORF type:complete len:191 (+),score=56.31 a1208_25:350-922(+)
MDSKGNYLVVGHAKRTINIYDIRNFQKPIQERESPLKHQTRYIACMPNGEGYAISSIEGRIGIEYFDPSPDIQEKQFAFKCHRKVVQDTTYVFPVNTIAFHSYWGTFASGGCDKTVYVWDISSRKRISQFPNFPTSISSIDINYTGSIMAIAASYTYEKGEIDHPPDAIYIKFLSEQDIRPRDLNQNKKI